MFELQERMFIRRFTQRILYFSVLISTIFLITQAIFHVFAWVESYLMEPVHHYVVDPAWDFLIDTLLGRYLFIPGILLAVWLLIVTLSIISELHRVGFWPTLSVCKFAVVRAARGSLFVLRTIFHTIPVAILKAVGVTITETPAGVKKIVLKTRASDDE